MTTAATFNAPMARTATLRLNANQGETGENHLAISQ